MGKNGEPPAKRSKQGVLDQLLDTILNVLSKGSQAGLEGIARNNPALCIIPLAYGMLRQEEKSEAGKAIEGGFRYGLLNPIKTFTGREAILETIHQSLISSSEASGGLCNVAAITQSMKDLNLNKNKNISSISGLGGIGKTQLAITYAHHNSRYYDNIIWIDGENLSDSFRKLAGNSKINIKIKDINGRDKEDNEIAREVYEHFKDRKSLFIFDNVEDCETVKKFIQKLPVGSGLYILITSRYQNWENVAKKVELNIFSEKDTEDLIMKHNIFNVLSKEELSSFIKRVEKGRLQLILSKLKEFSKENMEIRCEEDIQKIAPDKGLHKALKELILSKNQETEEGFLELSNSDFNIKSLMQSLEGLLEELESIASDVDYIKELHEKLQGLPLALQQAIAYIKRQKILDSNFGIENYLNEYDKSYKKIEELLSHEFQKDSNDPYMKTVMTTWQVTLDKIEKEDKGGKEAIRILNIMAYLAPDNIQSSIFSKRIGKEEPADAINLLRNYSMINKGRTPDSSNIHRLVQEVIRIKLKNEKKEEGVLRDVLKILKPVNSYSRSPNVSHAILICVLASEYGQLHDKINSLIPGLELAEEKPAKSLLKWVIRENRVDIMQYILDSMEDKWKKDNKPLLSGLLEYTCIKKVRYNHSMVKVLIQHGASVDFLPENNGAKLLETLKELGKLDKEEEFRWLIEAIENANLGVVKFILEDEPNLVKEKLKENCFAHDNNNDEYAYFVKKGSNISKLACEVKGWLYKEDKLNRKSKNFGSRNIEKIIALITKAEKKIRNVPSTLNNSTFIKSLDSGLGGEMVDNESDTESLLSVGDEDSGFEMIAIDDKESPTLEYYGSSTESLEGNLNDAMEDTPSSSSPPAKLSEARVSANNGQA